ncbi:hypothetical protein MASR1M90_04750 [Desulfovibrionales bacterium]
MKRMVILCILLCMSLSAHAAPVVVAATSWAAAFARAAGAEQVVVIAPENLQHPADYDPKPTDLLRLQRADFLVLGGFEGFANRLREAAASSAVVVQVHLDNSPETIRTEVLRLGELFGTQDAAHAFVQRFEQECAALRSELRDAMHGKSTRAVAHTFMTTWADFAGLDLLDTYGPGLLQPSDVLRLSSLRPDFVLDNGHMPGGAPIAEASQARLVTLINFPGTGMDLLDVFRANARALAEAIRQAPSPRQP